MDGHWTKYLALPAEITPFEQRFLTRLNKVALVFFYLHVPVLMAVAWAAGTGPLQALVFSLAVITGPTIAYRAILAIRRVWRHRDAHGRTAGSLRPGAGSDRDAFLLLRSSRH